MRALKTIFSILLVCFLVFYFVPLIIEGFKPETETLRAKASGIRTVKLLQHTMAYETAGKGRPVILVHGFTHSSLCWEKTVPALVRAGFRTYAVDLFGHGLSDKPYGIRYTLDLYARQVHDFMRAMNIQKAHIIGHSMGGAIAIKFTDMFPGMTDRLVLVGSAGSRHKGSPTTLFALLRYPLLGEFLINLNFRPVMRKSLSEITFNGRMEINGEYLDRYMLPAGTRGYDYTVLRILRNFNTPEWDASSSLNRIRNDVLIVHGSADRLIDVSRAREMNAELKKSKLVVIKDGPHSVMETDAAAVNNAILGFLQ